MVYVHAFVVTPLYTDNNLSFSCTDLILCIYDSKLKY